MDESAWIAVSFFILIGLLYWKVRNHVTEILDSKISLIRNSMSELESKCHKLGTEYAEIQDKFKLFQQECNDTINRAKVDVENIKERHINSMNMKLLRKEQELKSEIDLYYENARNEAMSNIVDSSYVLVVEYLKRKKVKNIDAVLSQLKDNFIIN